MEFTIKEINEKALYVLKRKNDGEFICEYVGIDDGLRKEIELDNIIKLVNNQEIDASEKIKLCNHLLDKLFNEYPFLFYERSYCNKYSLRSYLCDFKLITDRSDINIKADINSLSTKKTTEIKLCDLSRSTYNFESWINDYIHSHLIEKGYEKCKNENVLAYSHRKAGYIPYEFKVNEDLLVNVSTRFCFGKGSYFYVTLVYKGVKIIPYSRLLYHRFVDAKQLTIPTRGYECFDENWKYALDFIRNAGNELIRNGAESFFSKYILQEVEQLYQMLPVYLVSTGFKLSQNLNGTYFGAEEELKSTKLEGYELAVFRGEKMSGALSFIQNIRNLSELLPSEKYIKCIEKCAMGVLPELTLAISDLTLEIEITDHRINILEIATGEVSGKYTGVEKENFYNALGKLIKSTGKKTGRKGKNDFIILKEELTQRLPHYKELVDWHAGLRELEFLKGKSKDLIRYLSLTFLYKKTIDEYLRFND